MERLSSLADWARSRRMIVTITYLTRTKEFCVQARHRYKRDTKVKAAHADLEMAVGAVVDQGNAVLDMEARRGPAT